MARQDEIDDLLTPPPDPEIGFHKANVIAFNTGTFTNTLDIAGEIFTNVTVVGLADAAAVSPGSTVLVLRVKSAYYILGSMFAA